MTVAEVVRCSDGHFRRMVYGLGPYIADYPEQVLLACVVQGWCAKCVHYSQSISPAKLMSPAGARLIGLI